MYFHLLLSRPWVAPLVVFAVATCLKVLLIPAYHSTDFEVHRNWLAITHSLPVSKWYFEDTSEWTLDYPPLFAWFEWLLSWPAVAVDHAIVQVENLNYSASSCVLFQRCSVMVSDLVLLYAVVEYSHYKWSHKTSSAERGKQSLMVSLTILMNTGLFFVDHIHFQYNGLLYGILLLSITKIFQGKHLQAAGLFAVLLNFKHLYLYIAPAYFIYLLKHECFKQPPTNVKATGKSSIYLMTFSMSDFVKLGAIVIAVFSVSFAPLVYYGQLQQVISRLFPFKRGLCHAYWAPNFWALYNLADHVLAVLGIRLGVSPAVTGSMTSGVVGGMSHQILPSVPPWMTLLLTIAAMLPAIVHLWFKKSTSSDFLKCLILCGYGSFLFGWHVHEKAVMMMTIPLCLLAIEDQRYQKVSFILSTVAHLSLFPLLFQPAELLIKVCLFILYAAITLTCSLVISDNRKQTVWSDVTGLECGYLLFCILIQVYCLFVHGSFVFLAHLEFLPLLLTSVTCSIGVLWTWCLSYWIYLFG